MLNLDDYLEKLFDSSIINEEYDVVNAFIDNKQIRIFKNFLKHKNFDKYCKDMEIVDLFYEYFIMYIQSIFKID